MQTEEKFALKQKKLLPSNLMRYYQTHVRRYIYIFALGLVDKLIGTRNCEADERERINEMVGLNRLFARLHAFRKATL